MKRRYLFKTLTRLRSRVTVLWLAIMLLMMIVGMTVTHAAAAGGDAETPGVRSTVETGIWDMKRWSPYWVGIGIGILSWIAFVLSDKPIGVSTAYAQTSGMIEKALQGRQVEAKAYYREYVPQISWTWMLVVGLVIGAFVSAVTSGDFRLEWVPPLWEGKFGYSPIVRWAAAFSGGVVLGIGARWADGCTSGHGISGTLQLIVSSWIAVICFFIGGVVIAHIIY
ncbi:MAG: YeeE/YedE thiosulfate transporter family protein [Desulfobacterales bacterium]|jgi:uncharacterized membrane protein YedE/YeeE